LKLLILLPLLVITSLTLVAEKAFSDASLLGGPITVSAGGAIDGEWKDINSKESIDSIFWFSVDVEINENIRAYLASFIYRRLRSNGKAVEIDKVDIEQFIDEAYIEIKNVGGQPIAFIVGKQYIPFGLDSNQMPIYTDDPTYWTITETSGVFGFTVNLENLPFFDLVEISGFETEGYDLNISSLDGGSIRVSKEVTDNLKVKASYIQLGNEHSIKEAEKRVSLGFILKNGEWTTWLEGVHVSGNSSYPEMDIGVVGGIAKKVGKGRIVIQGSYLAQALKQIGFGYKRKIARNVTLASELRYTDYEYAKDGWSVSVRTLVYFSKIFKSKRNKNKKKSNESSSLEATLQEIAKEKK
jgi:hypothetical protein